MGLSWEKLILNFKFSFFGLYWLKKDFKLAMYWLASKLAPILPNLPPFSGEFFWLKSVNLEGVFFPTGESRVESHADLFPTGESPTKRRKEAFKGTITDCYLGTSKPDNFRQSPYCQSIAFSQLVYYMQVFVLSERFLERVQEVLFNYLKKLANQKKF